MSEVMGKVNMHNYLLDRLGKRCRIFAKNSHHYLCCNQIWPNANLRFKGASSVLGLVKEVT